jgi:hypothetical protein
MNEWIVCYMDRDVIIHCEDGRDAKGLADKKIIERYPDAELPTWIATLTREELVREPDESIKNNCVNC